METADIQHLAELSRIALTERDAGELATEFDSILTYVADVMKISADVASLPVVGVHANVFREDIETHEPGEYTEILLNAAPTREGEYIHVKKILGDKNEKQ